MKQFIKIFRSDSEIVEKYLFKMSNELADKYLKIITFGKCRWNC